MAITPCSNTHQRAVQASSPIREIAGHSREQTTGRRVNTLPTLDRVKAQDDAESVLSAESLPLKARSPHTPQNPHGKKKQMARKSVGPRKEEGSQSPFDKQRSQASTRIKIKWATLEEAPPGVLRRDEQFDASLERMCHADNSQSLVADSTVLPTVTSSQPVQRAPQKSTRNAESAISAATEEELLQQECERLTTLGDIQDHDNVQPLSTRTMQATFADDLDTVRSVVGDCLQRNLGKRHEQHVYLAESLLWRQRTCYESALRAQRRQRKIPDSSSLPQRYVQHGSPFESMSSIQIPFEKNSVKQGLQVISQEIFTRAKPKRAVSTSSWAVPTTVYRCDAVTIPSFREHVSLRTNLLADNESRLLTTPWLGDEVESRDELQYSLPQHYEMTHDEKGPLDLRHEQCRFYKDSVEASLSELGISWNEVLYWLLASDSLIKQTNCTLSGSSHFETILLKRSQYQTEVFDRDEEVTTTLYRPKSKKWQRFFAQLKETSAQQLRLAAVLCEAISNECNFNIWYLARQSPLVQDHVRRKIKNAQAVPKITYRQAACRVCHQ